MKIIKSFEDREYFSKLSDWWQTRGTTWYWGLGEDGDLYFYFPIEGIRDFWSNYNDYILNGGTIVPLIHIRDMKRIVKEFGHLIIFL